MEYHVARAQNGLIVTVIDKELGEENQLVYQENHADEVDAFADFLRELLDHYGPQTSRYSDKRIYIKVAPGDKSEAFTGEHAEDIWS